MLTDLDNLMRERAIEVLVVPMHEAMHPSFRWLSRGAKVTRGYAIKLIDREPVLVTYPMEREEAAATGLEVRLASEFGHERIFQSATNPSAAYAELFTNMLRALGARESLAFFGNLPLQLYLGVVEAMEQRGWRIHRSNGEDLIQLARKRKDAWEIEAIRSVGARTQQVVDGVRAMLRECAEGTAMTIGDLKRFVSLEIARLGMIEDHETILSQGRDAGVPHSRGDAAAPVRAGVPIVLDIFPADKTSGYFFDMTRTFCIGPVPAELRRLHADVFEAFTLARDAVRPGRKANLYQHKTCEYFEAKGYSTTLSTPATLTGYVHGLGHGVGLEIHEKPSFALTGDAIEVHDVITIEPGLYFPERELGVRIEDTFVVRENGVESLCEGGYGLEP